LEVNILSKLTHPNIMHIYEFYEDKANYYIVSELCKGGELFDDKFLFNGGF
jgi:serine/threonine protein kinase